MGFLIGLIGTPIMMAQPVLCFVVLLALLPFLVGVDPGVSITEQLFAGLIVAWLVAWVGRTLVSRRPLRINYPTDLVHTGVAVNVLLLFSAINGLLQGAPILDIVRDLSQFIGYFVIIPVATMVRDRQTAKFLLIILFIIGAISYLWNTYFWVSVKHGLGWLNLPTLGAGAAYLGPFLAAVWPLALWKTKIWLQILSLLVIFGMMSLSIWSGYRTRVIGVIASAVFALFALYLIDRRGKPRIVLVGLTVLLGIIAILYGSLTNMLPLVPSERIQQIYNTLLNPSLLVMDLSVQGRLVEAQAALDVFARSPLFGVGFGHHVPMDWPYGRWYKTSFTQHIWMTEMLMKFGIVGSILFLWFFFSAIRFAFKRAKEARPIMAKALAVGIIVWMITMLIPTLGHFGDRGFNLTLAVVLAILPFLGQSHHDMHVMSRGHLNGSVGHG